MSAGEFTARAVVLRLYAYDFYKKVNSTKRIGTAGVSNNMDYAYTHGHWTQGGEGHFSGGTSYYKPTIDWDMGKRYSGDNAYTYDSTDDGNAAAVIFPRYLVALTETTNGGLDYRRPLFYFVDDGEMQNGHIMRLYCTMDVLATFKDDLLRCSAFVLRSSTGYDGNISDSYIVPTTNVVDITPSDATLIPGFNSGGTDLIVRTVGKTGVNNFVLTPANLKAIFENTYDDTTQPSNPASFADLIWTSVGDALESLGRILANPAQYLQSVKWFPCDLASSQTEYVSFGYVTSTSQYPIAKDSLHAVVSIAKPAKYYNDWRDKDRRFTKLCLYLPCIGLVDVDPLYYDKNLVAEYGIDTNTGACAVLLTAGGCPIGWFSGQAGVDIPVGGINSGSALASMGVGAGVSALSGNIVGVLSSVAGGVNEALLSPSQTVFGATGNRAVWDIAPNIIMYRTTMGSSGNPVMSEGSPCYQYKQLSTLTGFVKCASGTFMESLNPDALPLAPDTIMCKEIKDAINAFMVNGFYIEDDSVFQFDQQTKTR